VKEAKTKYLSDTYQVETRPRYNAAANKVLSMSIEYYIPKTKHFKHQKDVLERSANEPYWAYFLEPGLGKSKLLIDNAAYLYESGKIEAMVISTVKGMCPSFEFVEIPAHIPERISYLTFRYDAGKSTSKDFKLAWKDFLQFNGFKVFIFNVDAAKSVKLIEMMRQLYRKVNNRFIMGIDESSTIKTHTAKRSKAVVRFCRAASYRRILTGTPITNGPLEVFGQAIALAPPETILGHKSFYSFRNYFANVEKKTFGNRSFQVVTGYKNTNELTELMSTFSSIIKKEDALDLPDKIYSRVVVEMPAAQKKTYETLKQEAIIELEELGESIEVTNILTLLVKLHQIVCGQLKYEDQNGREQYATIENNRLSTLMDLLEAETGKVVIWSNYKQTLRDIARSISDKYGAESVIEFHGSIKQSSRETAAARFQDKNDPSRFFVANPQSAGMGLTLTTSDLAIYYSNSHSLEQRIQSEDRIHRIGQLASARYVDLVSPNTVDDKIIDALRKKRNLADRIVVSNWRNLL